MTIFPINPLRRANSFGISLFEMLLTISILGIMTALALPTFGQQRDAFSDVKAKRNAQEMVAECTVAMVAGVNFSVGATVDETIERLIKGAKAVEGTFAGRSFGLRQMSAEDAQEAAKFLKVANGQLMLR